MKKSVILLIILIAVCAQGMAHSIREQYLEAEKYDLRFGVISDTHVGGRGRDDGAYPLHQRFEKALDWYNTQDVKALAIVGDIVDSGTQANWDIFKESWEKHKGGLQLIAVMGNHEATRVDDINTAADRFEEATGQKTNAHYVIDGYHFIVLNAGEGNFNEQGELGGAIATGRTDTPGYTGVRDDMIPLSVKEWVRMRVDIAKSEAPGKPVFLFMHWPVRNTFFKTQTESVTSIESEPDTWFFKDDPEVVVFGGHVHNPNNEPRCIWQGGFTSVNTATLNYIVMGAGYLGNDPNGTANSSAPKIADRATGHGMIVSVKGSKVTIENYDFDFSEGPRPLSDVVKIPQVWEFDITKPADFPYTHAKRETQKTAPVFDETKPADAYFDRITIKTITDTSVEVEFPQAKILGSNPGMEEVHSYLFEFINLQTGDVEHSARQWSDFMLTPRLQKPVYTQLVGGLSSDTEYELRIYAYGSFQERSGQYLVCTFRTLDQ